MFALSMFSFSACSQALKESQVPMAVKKAFEKNYPRAKASWDREGANYEANFRQDGKTMSALIEENGTIVETETNIPVTDLPKEIQVYVEKHYAVTKIEEAAKIVKANGDINYEAEVHHKDIIFDATGKFMREVKE